MKYKINKREMAKLLLMILFSPVLLILSWGFALAEAVALTARGRFLLALCYAVVTPFSIAFEAPGYFRARWRSITNYGLQ